MISGIISLLVSLWIASCDAAAPCDGYIAPDSVSAHLQSTLSPHIPTLTSIQFGLDYAATRTTPLQPMTLCVLPGIHTVTDTLWLYDKHSLLTLTGVTTSNANDAAIISGGVAITNDMLSDCPSSPLTPAGSKWFCYTPPSHVNPTDLQSRHLYVDNIRATRLQATSDVVSAFQSNSVTSVSDMGYVVSLSKYPALREWIVDDISTQAQQQIEFVYTAEGGSPWTQSRCTVANIYHNISSSDLFINMKQPCFAMLRNKPCQQGDTFPSSIENVPLRTAQTWMQQEQEQEEEEDMGQLEDDKTGPSWYLYYPSSGDMNVSIPIIMILSSSQPTAIIMPIVEVLMASTVITDTSANAPYSISNFTLDHLTFAYATWSRTSGSLGYVEQQSGALVDTLEDCKYCHDYTWSPTPGHLIFYSPLHVHITNCIFTHLGTVAIQFTGGAHYSVVANSYFYDVSGTSVQIGDYNTSSITMDRWQEVGNVVNNTIIDRVSVEYMGNCGIQVGYSRETTLSHLTVSHLTYGGICMGWGWANHPISYAASNTISYSHITHFKSTLGDGGGIYVLGPQTGSVMHDNWMDTMYAGRAGGGYYPDEGSSGWEIYSNVFSNATACSDNCEWLHIWTSSIHDIHVYDCYTDTATMENHGTNCTVDNITVIDNNEQWPPLAMDIMNGAGATLLQVAGNEQHGKDVDDMATF